MKILLLTSYFYPDEHIGAARWNRLAKYLLRDGHELYVVASDNGASSERFALCNGITRVNSQSSLPDRLLKIISRAKKGVQIEKGRQSYSLKPKNGLVAAYSRTMNLLGRLARFPNVYWWSAHEMVKAGIDIINSKKIDIIVATHPFAGCLRAAHAISARTGIPWVADMRDGWSSYYYGEYRHGSILNKMLIPIENFYLQKAAKVVAVNATLANTLHVNRGNVEVIHNVFDPEEVTPYSYNHNNNKALVFAFAGSIHDNHCWDIFFSGLADCLSEMKENNLIINYYGVLFEKLRANGIASGIPGSAFIDHGYIGKKAQLQLELRRSDLLVVFGFSGPFGDSVTTGKIFDYIEAGRPIIVVGPTTSELALTVAETGIGIITSDVDAVKSIAIDLLKNKAALLDRIVAKKREEALLKYSAAEAAKTYSKMLTELVYQNHHHQCSEFNQK
jgi:glycosyltransferase involved in cell wall biosynthesis